MGEEPEPEPEPEPQIQPEPVTQPEPEHDASAGEHNAALFTRFDADKDGFLSLEECKHAAATLFPDEEWDNELWPGLCEAYGADATKGMDAAQFATFVAHAEADHEDEPVDFETELFYRFDADADGLLSLPECKSAAKVLFPDDDWDDNLWPELCSSYGADPAKGLSIEQFRAFRTAANVVATEERQESTALAQAEAVGGTGWEAMNFPLRPEHLAAVPTYLLPCEKCGAYQQIRRTSGVIGGGDGLCASCQTPLASLHQKVMEGGQVLREATKDVGPLVARCCNVDGCAQVCVLPGGVNAYWKCPSNCGGLVPDEGVVTTESEDKLAKLRAAFEVGALTEDEYSTAEHRILLQRQTAIEHTRAFLSEMTRDRAAAVRFGVPIHGANDDEAARALFAEYDRNGNGYIGADEVRGLAAALLPDEPWDDSLWPEMCGEYGVDPALGFDFAAFLAFKADAEHGAIDEDEDAARALFVKYDANGNGYIGADEVRGLAAALLPGEPWDDSLWPEMCGEYGVDPALGFDFAAFLAFKADAEHLMETVSGFLCATADHAFPCMLGLVAECRWLLLQKHKAVAAKGSENASAP